MPHSRTGRVFSFVYQPAFALDRSWIMIHYLQELEIRLGSYKFVVTANLQFRHALALRFDIILSANYVDVPTPTISGPPLQLFQQTDNCSFTSQQNPSVFFYWKDWHLSYRVLFFSGDFMRN